MKPLNFTLLAVAILAATQVFAYEEQLQEQVKQKDWQTADRLLQHAELQCRQDNNPTQCLDKITFSRAWTYAQHGAQGDGNSVGYLQQARDGYLAVLQNHPDHLPTIDNLILVLEQLGDREHLASLLQTLQRLQDHHRYARTALIIADSYRSSADNRQAFAYYDRAYAMEPSQLAISGMTAVFSQSPSDTETSRLLGFARETQDLAKRRQFYEAVLHARGHVSQKQWEDAALFWVVDLGRERRLTADVIEETIDLQANPEFRELAGRLKDRFLGLQPGDVKFGDLTLLEYRRDGWWNKSLLRTWAFAIAAWSEGHNRLLHGDVEAANALWQAALQFAPPSYEYHSPELADRWAVSLELLTDLARIQWLYKARIDPQGETFKRIEKTLFFSKAEAYQVNDLVAIQRHHAVMGKMYADLGLFSNGDTGIRSAEFQLSHALKTAELLSSKTGKSEPQPQLAELLADGYNCRLPGQGSSCRRDEKKAQQLYLKATTDYLKLDAVMRAKNTLQTFKIIQPKPDKQVKQLETMIDLRTSLTNDMLNKSVLEPDILARQIDIAKQWQLMGESDKAKDSISQALTPKGLAVDKLKVYRQLEAGDTETLKRDVIREIQLRKIKTP
jgi:hypothetical protein